MNVVELRQAFLDLLTDIRSAGRSASRSVLANSFDERLPALLLAADAHFGETVADSSRERVRQAVLAAGRARAQNASTSVVEPGPMLRWPKALPVRPWTWGLVGAAAVILFAVLVYNFIRKPEIIVKPGPAPKSSVPIPKSPSLRPEGPVVNKDPKTDIRSVPLLPRKKSSVARGPEKKKDIVVVQNLPKAGTFGAVMGEPLVYVPGIKKGIAAMPGMTVVSGSRIETGDADKLEIRTNDGSVLRLGYNTTLTFPTGAIGSDSTEVDARDFELTSGWVVAKVAATADKSKFLIRTPVATAEALGTEFSLELERISSSKKNTKAKPDLRALLQVREGSVAFYNGLGHVVAPMMTESIAISGTAPTEPKRVRTLKQFKISLGTHEWNLVFETEQLRGELAEPLYVYPRGWAGLTVQNLPGGRVPIVEVLSGSISAKAGLRVGDNVISLNGGPATSADAVRRYIAQRLGKQITVTVERQGKRLQFSLTPVLQFRLPSLPERLAKRLYAATSPAMSGDANGSVRMLQKLAAEEPYAAVLNNLAVAYQTEDDFGHAIRCYKEAVRLDPLCARYRYHLGLALQLIGNIERSAEELESAVALDPYFDDAILNLARTYTIMDRTDDALRVLDEALEHRPNRAHFWVGKTYTLNRARRYEDAMRFAERAIEIDPNLSWAHFEHARSLKFQRRFVDAERAYRRAIEIDPTRVIMLGEFGTLLGDLGKFKEAEETLRRAIDLDPSSANTHNKLGLLFGKQRRYSEAEIHHREATRLDPEFEAAHSNLGIVLKELGRFEDAEQAYRTAMRLNPNSFGAHYNLGSLFLKQNRFAEAEGMFQLAIEIAPINPLGFASLGFTLDALKRPKEAEEAFRKSLQIDPTYPFAVQNYAKLLQVQGRVKEAIAVYQKAFELGSRAGDLSYNFAEILYSNGRVPEAEAAYRKCLEWGFRIAAVYGNLGSILSDSGRVQEAESMFRKGVEAEPNNGWVRGNLGIQQYRAGNYQEAETALRKSIELDPKGVQPHGYLGLVLEETHRLEEALVMFRKAVELNPQHTEWYPDIARALDNLGRHDDAVAAYEKALEVAPNNASANDSLAWLFERMGRIKEAEVRYRKAIEIDPTYAFAISNLAVLLKDKFTGRENEAEELFRKAIAVRPSLTPPYRALADLLSSQGGEKEAEDLYKKAISLNPNDLFSHESLAAFYGRSGRFQESVAVYREAVRVNPNDPHLHALLGWNLIENHLWAEAANTLRKCVELDREGQYKVNTLENLGFALIHAGELSEAEKTLTDLLKLAPNEPGPSSVWALLLATKGVELSDALSRAKKSAEVLKEQAEYWHILGFVHFKRREFDLAIAPLEKAVAGYGKVYLAADSLVTLGKVYEAKKDKASAIKTYKRALVIEKENKPAIEALKRLGG